MAQKIIEELGRWIRDEYLLIAVLAVIPVTEIKGALLYAAVVRADLLKAYLVAFLSSAATVLAILPIFPLLLRLAERSRRVRAVTSFLTGRLEDRAGRIVATAGAKGSGRYVSRLLVGLFAFVAVPLPFTGIWAGAMLAAIMRLSYKESAFALIAGNFTAGGVVLAVSLLAGGHASVVLDVFVCVAIILFSAMTIKAILKRMSKGAQRERKKY